MQKNNDLTKEQIQRIKEQNDMNDQFLAQGVFKSWVEIEQELRDLGVKDPKIQFNRMGENSISYILEGKTKWLPRTVETEEVDLSWRRFPLRPKPISTMEKKDAILILKQILDGVVLEVDYDEIETVIRMHLNDIEPGAGDWKCPNWTEETALEHGDRCENCVGECGGELCLDCCNKEFEGGIE